MSASKAARASSGSLITRNPNWATLCLSNSRRLARAYRRAPRPPPSKASRPPSEINAPVSGEVVEVNSALTDSPGLVNEDPFGKGWFLKIKLTDAIELDSLLDEDAYREFLKAVS